MEEQRTKLLIITVTSILIFLGLVFAVGYAWFGADVTQSGNNSLVVDAARLGTITYYTGNTINVGGIYPGWCETKRVNIKSTNATVSNSYVIKLNVVTNEFKAAGGNSGYIQMKATVVSGSSSGTSTLNAINIIATSGSAEILRGTLPANGTHTYDIEFCFPEQSENQNSQQGKRFNAYLSIETVEEESCTPAVAFATDDWETIICNVKNGTDSAYHVGDTKSVALSGGYGTQSVRIANKTTTGNCSDSDYSETACGFVLEFSDIIESVQMDSGYFSTYVESSLRNYLNTTIYQSLPEDLQNGIIDTRVISVEAQGESSTTLDKLYLLAPIEITGLEQSHIYDYMDSTQSRQLDYYTDSIVEIDFVELIGNKGMKSNDWWLRSCDQYYGYNLFITESYDYSGYYEIQHSNSSISKGISPAFRIG